MRAIHVRMFIYTAFLIGTLLFLVSGVRQGSVLTVAAASFFALGELAGLGYLELRRERRDRER